MTTHETKMSAPRVQSPGGGGIGGNPSSGATPSGNARLRDAAMDSARRAQEVQA